MAATVVTPSPPLPAGGSTGVEPVRHGGPDRREARAERRRREARPAGENAEEPEAVERPKGRLDVVA